MFFCEKLANMMKLDQIAGDAGLDVNGEALLARAKQLVKLEVGMRSGRTRTKTDGRTDGPTDGRTDRHRYKTETVGHGNSDIVILDVQNLKPDFILLLERGPKRPQHCNLQPPTQTKMV